MAARAVRRVQRSGVVNLNDFLRRELLDSNPAKLPSEQDGSAPGFLASSANLALRGFSDADETIIMVNGRRLKLRYMTQAKARPPTFIAFGTRVERIPDDYQRYLTNSLRDSFDMQGVPIRFNLRKGDNPYDKS